MTTPTDSDSDSFDDLIEEMRSDVAAEAVDRVRWHRNDAIETSDRRGNVYEQARRDVDRS